MIKKPIKIMGERIFLRTLTPEDVNQTYLNWMENEEVKQFLETRWEKYTLESLKEYVKSKYESPNDFMFGIFLKENNEHIGNIKIGSVHPIHNFGDLGIMIGNKKMWCKGYATEAIKLLTEFALNELNLNKLIAGINELNIGSYKAFMKAGYREVGRFKKHALYKGKYTDSIYVEKGKE